MKIYYSVCNSASLDPTLSQLNLVSCFPTRCGFKTKQILNKCLVSLKIPTFFLSYLTIGTLKWNNSPSCMCLVLESETLAL